MAVADVVIAKRGRSMRMGDPRLPDRLPNGFAVQLDRRVRLGRGGAVVVDGADRRIVPVVGDLRALEDGGRLEDNGRLEVRDGETAHLARALMDAALAHPRPRSGPSHRDVTVVIPVADNEVGLRRLISSLRGLRVIVVDDASASPIREDWFTHSECTVSVLRQDTRVGPAATRNLGWRRAASDFVVFLDADVVPRKGWLETLLGHFTDPTVALVAPRVVCAPAALDTGSGSAVARYEMTRCPRDLGHREAPVAPDSPVKSVTAAAMVVRRSALRAEGGFDETLPCAEGTDLCWRLTHAGWRLRYEPVSLVMHDDGSRLRTWLAGKALHGSSQVPLARRHPGAAAPVIAPAATVGAWLGLLIGKRWGYFMAVVCAAWSVRRYADRLRLLDRPTSDGLVWCGLAQLAAARQLVRVSCRQYWPLSLLLCVVSRRFRWTLITAAIAEGVVDWWARPSADAAVRAGVVEHVVLRRLDDVSSGVGLWAGVVAHRSGRALVPRFTD